MDKGHIISSARALFAEHGYDGLSMRTLAAALGVQQSVLYHYYPGKDALLEDVFHVTNRELGAARAREPAAATAAAMLHQRLRFQFEHIEEIVAVLKYYLHYRDRFQKRADGFLPEKAALHIEEVLEFGVRTGEFQVDSVPATAKVIAHAINGYLLEYYPADVGEEDRDAVIADLEMFILRSLRPRN